MKGSAGRRREKSLPHYMRPGFFNLTSIDKAKC